MDKRQAKQLIDDYRYSVLHTNAKEIIERQNELVYLLTRGGPTPAYVHALLDALLTGSPINFRGAEVPDDVRNRLEGHFGMAGGGKQT